MTAKRWATGGALTAKQQLSADMNDPNGVRAVMEHLMSAAGPIEQFVEDVIRFCKAELSKNISCEESEPRSGNRSVPPKKFEHPSPQWYCAQLISLGNFLLRSFQGDSSVRTVARVMYDFARYWKELQILNFEDPVEIGLKVEQGGKKGAAARDPLGQNAERNNRIKTQYEATRGDVKFKEEVVHRLAEQNGLSTRQVERILKKKS